jgi:hypothetical protein
MKLILFGNTQVADILAKYEDCVKYEPGLTKREFYKRIGKEMPVKKDTKKKGNKKED